MKTLSIILFVVCLSIVASRFVCADTVLDAEYYVPGQIPNNTFGGSGIPQIFIAQTYTVVNTGRLVRVEFPSFNRLDSPTAPELILAVCPVDSNGVPLAWPANELLRVSVNPQDTPFNGCLTFDLSSLGGLPVSSGQVIALGVGTNGPHENIGYYTIGSGVRVNSDPYTGGEYFARFSDGSWNNSDVLYQPGLNVDMYFRAYVDVVPEPGSFIVLLTGVGTLFASVRRIK